MIDGTKQALIMHVNKNAVRRTPLANRMKTSAVLPISPTGRVFCSELLLYPQDFVLKKTKWFTYEKIIE